jgi:hypothetical protein
LEDLQKTRSTYVNALEASGVSNANSYVTSLKSYTPKVSTPRLTAGRVEGGLTVSKNRSGSAVANLVASEKELNAGQEASYKALQQSIEDAKAQAF